MRPRQSICRRLRQYGLDDPEPTVRVGYTWEDEDNQDHSETFTLQVSRDPDERNAAADDTQGDASGDAYTITLERDGEEA